MLLHYLVKQKTHKMNVFTQMFHVDLPIDTQVTTIGRLIYTVSQINVPDIFSRNSRKPMRILSNPISALNVRESPKFSRPTENRGRGTR